MCQVNHNRLLTRKRMAKWDGGRDTCLICRLEMGDLRHALRDCAHARAVWDKLIPYKRRQEFYEEEWRVWLQKNLRWRGRVEEELFWQEYFAIGCWYIWKWRNGQVHDPEYRTPWKTDEVIVKYFNSYRARWKEADQ